MGIEGGGFRQGTSESRKGVEGLRNPFFTFFSVEASFRATVYRFERVRSRKRCKGGLKSRAERGGNQTGIYYPLVFFVRRFSREKKDEKTAKREVQETL